MNVKKRKEKKKKNENEKEKKKYIGPTVSVRLDTLEL